MSIKHAEVLLKGCCLQIRPLEEMYKFGAFFSSYLNESDFYAKPSVLLLGQYSTGPSHAIPIASCVRHCSSIYHNGRLSIIHWYISVWSCFREPSSWISLAKFTVCAASSSHSLGAGWVNCVKASSPQQQRLCVGILFLRRQDNVHQAPAGQGIPGNPHRTGAHNGPFCGGHARAGGAADSRQHTHRAARQALPGAAPVRLILMLPNAFLPRGIVHLHTSCDVIASETPLRSGLARSKQDSVCRVHGGQLIYRPLPPVAKCARLIVHCQSKDGVLRAGAVVCVNSCWYTLLPCRKVPLWLMLHSRIGCWKQDNIPNLFMF